MGIDRNRNQSGSGINVVEEQIVTYFDSKGKAGNNPVQGGFYRRLIGKRGNEYTVQDFYYDNNQKRTDPYTLERNRLLDFHAHPENGTLATYAYNGNPMQQKVYQNGRLVNAKY